MVFLLWRLLLKTLVYFYVYYVNGSIIDRLIPLMCLCDAMSARRRGGLHEHKENIKIQS